MPPAFVLPAITAQSRIMLFLHYAPRGTTPNPETEFLIFILYFFAIGGIRIRQHRSYYVGLTTAIMFAAAGAMFVYRWLAAGSYLRPPFLPRLRELDLFRVFPRPPPPFFRPPRSDLFTVAQARRSASLALIPRFL
jgi:hypothetical protein